MFAKILALSVETNLVHKLLVSCCVLSCFPTTQILSQVTHFEASRNPWPPWPGWERVSRKERWKEPIANATKNCKYTKS